MYTVGSRGATGSILAPPIGIPERDPWIDGVEPGHTPRPTSGREVRMLLSFQRPSRRFGEGILPQAPPKHFESFGADR